MLEGHYNYSGSYLCWMLCIAKLKCLKKTSLPLFSAKVKVQNKITVCKTFEKQKEQIITYPWKSEVKLLALHVYIDYITT